mmetsp:Transcript_102713/g.306828  ORF Transcript_102713/g.306828 Transcript_102713/m.306828 type:complete len:268 (-) Transcript_102713:770-1573(-)
MSAQDPVLVHVVLLEETLLLLNGPQRCLPLQLLVPSDERLPLSGPNLGRAALGLALGGFEPLQDIGCFLLHVLRRALQLEILAGHEVRDSLHRSPGGHRHSLEVIGNLDDLIKSLAMLALNGVTDDLALLHPILSSGEQLRQFAVELQRNLLQLRLPGLLAFPLLPDQPRLLLLLQPHLLLHIKPKPLLLLLLLPLALLPPEAVLLLIRLAPLLLLPPVLVRLPLPTILVLLLPLGGSWRWWHGDPLVGHLGSRRQRRRRHQLATGL